LRAKAALLMSIIGGVAWLQWGEANQAKIIAQTERDKATAARDEATVARDEADQAKIIAQGERDNATQLVGAWRDLREQLILTGHGNDLRSAVFSPDGKRGPIWNDQ